MRKPDARRPALWFLPAIAFAWAQVAHAEIPEAFQPLVVKPPFSLSERVVDLTPAFEKARQLRKPLLVYLGASDCPPCKEYTRFLDQHQGEMQPVFDSVVLVDIRTWLRGPKMSFRIDGKSYTVAEFKAAIGDSNKELFYPSWWLLTPEGKQVRQLPRGTGSYLTVDSHARLIKGS